MANQYVNKVKLGSETLIDLTGDDVTRGDVLQGVKFHLPSGEPTTGTGSGGTPTTQAKTATPTLQQQVISPDSGYDYLTQVTVNAIPVTRTDNSAGGVTVTIG